MKKGKLVRDKIPEIIIADGKKPIIRILDNDEYLQELDKKLNEEIAEYQADKSVEEMAAIFGFDRMVDIDEVHSRVSSFLREIKSDVDGNEIMDMAKLVYKGMRANFIRQRAEEIVEAINTIIQ